MKFKKTHTEEVLSEISSVPADICLLELRAARRRPSCLSAGCMDFYLERS